MLSENEGNISYVGERILSCMCIVPEEKRKISSRWIPKDNSKKFKY
jgi:hypothetical protein